MGMDFNIYSARNREVFKHEGWYDSPQVQEEFYSRKAWHFVEDCPFIPNSEEDCPVEITQENLEDMIKVACARRNYFDTYDDVPKLCELRDKYEELKEEGKKLFCLYG